MKGKIIGGSVAGVLAITLALVKPWEGYAPEPYIDIVGVATYCYGDTGPHEQRRYSEQECAAKLNSRLGQYLTGISGCIKQPLTVNQYAAVLSISYNVGVGAICSSTMVKLINRGEPGSVWCRQFDRWVYAGGKKINGLVNRRSAEKALCLKG